MKRILRILALAIVVATGIAWLTLGANRGWTRTTVPVKTVDEVTGIEGIEYQKKFLPGLDVLGAALLGGGVLAGASFLFNQKQTEQN